VGDREARTWFASAPPRVRGSGGSGSDGNVAVEGLVGLGVESGDRGGWGPGGGGRGRGGKESGKGCGKEKEIKGNKGHLMFGSLKKN
jgi:hypothetical protein